MLNFSLFCTITLDSVLSLFLSAFNLHHTMYSDAITLLKVFRSIEWKFDWWTASLSDLDHCMYSALVWVQKICVFTCQSYCSISCIMVRVVWPQRTHTHWSKLVANVCFWQNLIARIDAAISHFQRTKTTKTGRNLTWGIVSNVNLFFFFLKKARCRCLHTRYAFVSACSTQLIISQELLNFRKISVIEPLASMKS